MPYVKKKDIERLRHHPFVGEVIEEHGHDFLSAPPDTWTQDETNLFDMLADLEDKILNKLMEITDE